MPRPPPVTRSTFRCTLSITRLLHKVVASLTTWAARPHPPSGLQQRQEMPMRRTVDYYFAPQSPWMYLGHARFTDIAQRAGAEVRVRPVDYGQIFAVSGGLPLPKRAPQRQAYRLVELRRFSETLGIPLNPEPRHFPVAGDPAGWLITAVADQDGADAALRLTGAVGCAIWAQERNVADD